MRTLGMERLSKSQVSRMAKELDAEVTAFRNRPLDAGPFTFVSLGALTQKVREGGRIVDVAVVIRSSSTMPQPTEDHRREPGRERRRSPGLEARPSLRLWCTRCLYLATARLIARAWGDVLVRA